MVVDFCFIGGWCYSKWWWSDLVTFALFQGIGMSPRLFQDYGSVYKILRPSPLVVEHSLMVMTTSSQSRGSQIESYG